MLEVLQDRHLVIKVTKVNIDLMWSKSQNYWWS